MEVEDAIARVDHLVFMPKWKFTATDDTHRFEGGIVMCVEYPSVQTNKADARKRYPQQLVTKASFRIPVKNLDEDGLIRAVINVIMTIHCHETREALRCLPTYEARFHPHRQDGIDRWGDPQGDFNFGIA